jgi:hypothetical protein
VVKTTRIQISRGRASVSWNDNASPADPVQIVCAGLTVMADDEAELRDLYECLDFLFGRPGGK